MSVIAPALLLDPALLQAGTGDRDYFAEEMVCVHVYDPKGTLPEPLLVPKETPQRKDLFQIGLPEAALCSTRSRLLDTFPYFWPISPEEMRSFQDTTTVIFQRQVLEGKKDVDDLVQILKKEAGSTRADDKTLALILTLNDRTYRYTPDLIDGCRNAGIEELVIFKDPSRPPYLCSHSPQKKFKRPPPIPPSVFRSW